MSSAGLTIADLRSCEHQLYPCNYQVMVAGNGTEIKRGWYKGFVMQKGAKLYIGCLKSSEPWWKTGPPQGVGGRPGPFFTTVIKRAEAFNGYVLEYDVKTDTHLIYTGKSGGWETQEEVFKEGYIGYFSCKECEVSVTNGHAWDFVDWEHVRDVSDIVFGRNFASSSSSADDSKSNLSRSSASTSATQSKGKLKKD